MAPPQSLNTVTFGLYPDSQGTMSSLVTGGLQSLVSFTPTSPNSTERTNIVVAGSPLGAAVSAQIGPITIGAKIGTILTGVGRPLTGPFNSDLASLPSITNTIFNPYSNSHKSALSQTTYTGTDLNIIIDLVDTPTTSNRATPALELVQCTTFTISMHREKSPVRACGYIGPKAYARGKRTIAGTIILTQFVLDTLYTFLLSQKFSGHDLSKDTVYVKADQLPPFNMTLLFADEFGNVSYRRVLGVDAVTDGVVHSVQDMISEQTITYVASDFTPLLSIDDSALYTPDKLTRMVTPEPTVQSYMANRSTGSVLI